MDVPWRKRPLTEWPVKLPMGDGSFSGWTEAPLNARGWAQPKRHAVVDAVRRQYAECGLEPPVDRLAHPDSRVVVSGHQLLVAGGAGLFHHKIWSTISVARELSAQWGVPVVPVHWMATEDHDFVEVSALHGASEVHRWTSPCGQQPMPVGQLPLDGLEAMLESWLADGSLPSNSPDAQSLKAHLNTAIEANETLADLMRRWIHAWYGPHGLVVLDAQDPSLKAMASPLWAAEMKDEGLATCVEHGAVHVRDNQVFWLGEGGRVGMVPGEEPGSWQAGDQRWPALDSGWEEWSAAHAAQCSPGVLLRPLYQEWLLESAAVVVGPSEWKYWLQTRPGFEKHGLTFPSLRLRDHAVWLPQAALALGWELSDGWLNADRWSQWVLDGWMKEHEATKEQAVAQMQQWRGQMQTYSAELAPNLDGPTGALFAQVDKAMATWKKKVRRGLKAHRQKEWDAAADAGALLVREGMPQDRWLNGHAMVAAWAAEQGTSVSFDEAFRQWLALTEGDLEPHVWKL